MKIIWNGTKAIPASAQTVIIPWPEGKKAPALKRLDESSRREITARARAQKYTGQSGKFLYLQERLDGKKRPAVLCVGLGDDDLVADKFRGHVGKALVRAVNHGTTAVCLLLDAEEEQFYKLIRWTAQALVLSAYRFDSYKTEKSNDEKVLEKLWVGTGESTVRDAKCRASIARGEAEAHGVSLARDLVNEPANVLSPKELAARAKSMARREGLGCVVLDEKQIRQKKMRLFLSVAAGSERAPRFIHLTYKPAKKAKAKIALVGKGVMFDSGGLCVKPPKSMYDMKTDMAGSALVMGVMSALPALAPSVEVHGIIPATDNAINGKATMPGDVIESMSGLTVEILNTDAEGRLILADALTYAAKLGADAVVDFATLTGACVVALGEDCAGLFSDDEQLAAGLSEAASQAGELIWRMPLLEGQREAIKSPVADIKNIGGQWGGAISAAQFLKCFAPKSPWAHVDIAGPARTDGADAVTAKGGTGYGVLTALAYIDSLG